MRFYKFAIEAYDFENSSREKRHKQLVKTFFYGVICSSIITAIGGVFWVPYWFLCAGGLVSLIILCEPITNHHLPFRLTRAGGIITGSAIGFVVSFLAELLLH